MIAQIFLKNILAGAQLTDDVNSIILNPSKFIGGKILPASVQNVTVYNTVTQDDSIEILKPVSGDSQFPRRQLNPETITTYKPVKLGKKITYNEEDANFKTYLEYKKAIASGRGGDSLASAVLELRKNIVQRVDAEVKYTQEAYIWQALTGSITFDTGTVDYDFNVLNKPVLTGGNQWTNTTAPAVSQIRTWLDRFRGTGLKGSAIYMNSNTFRNLIKTTELTEYYGALGGKIILLQDPTNGVTVDGVPVVVYDEGATIGSTFTTFIPDGKVIITATTGGLDVGKFIIGQDATNDWKAGAYVITQEIGFDQSDRKGLKILYGMTGLPAFLRPNGKAVVCATVY
jgi:hypothetical protein